MAEDHRDLGTHWKGKPTTVNTRVVSANGKTLTVTSKGVNAQGQKLDNVQVFEKG